MDTLIFFNKKSTKDTILKVWGSFALHCYYIATA